jgi:hypothetical protein
MSLQGPAICFLTKYPSEELLDFAIECSQSENYTIYICSDMSCDLIKQGVNIISINNEECSEMSFKGMSDKPLNAWDKSFYYFSVKLSELHNYVWFIEDDVFVPSAGLFKSIDIKYPFDDLLCSNLSVNNRQWYWTQLKQSSIFKRFEKHLGDPARPLEYSYGLMCAIRISCSLLLSVREIALLYDGLFCLEVLIPMLCIHKNMAARTIEELKYITWRGKFKKFERGYMYHPIKDIQGHPGLRKAVPDDSTG